MNMEVRIRRNGVLEGRGAGISLDKGLVVANSRDPVTWPQNAQIRTWQAGSC
jgi:hypothetical protein